MSKILDSQAQIVSSLQQLLIGAIAKEDWGATKQWADFLYTSVQTLTEIEKGGDMAYKDSIDILKKAIADKDAIIANLEAQNSLLKSDDDKDKRQIAELLKAQEAADELAAAVKKK